MAAQHFLVPGTSIASDPGCAISPDIQMGRAMTSETTSTDAAAADDGGAIDARVQAVQGQVVALEAALSASRKSSRPSFLDSSR